MGHKINEKTHETSSQGYLAYFTNWQAKKIKLDHFEKHVVHDFSTI